MHDIEQLIAQHGSILVFVNVLLEQLGLPVPAIPTLMVAGALAVEGKLSTLALFGFGITASLIGDAVWYAAGRYYGNRVMRTLCKVSLTPDYCVNQTQSQFERWGVNALVIAKFIPGLATIAPPLAGATGIRWFRFLVLSAIGAALWVAAGLGIGMLFRPQVEWLLAALDMMGTTALVTVGGLCIAYIAYKWWDRRRFFLMLRVARINVDDLYRLIDAGAEPVIVDVRSTTARTMQPQRIPGAVHVPLQAVDAHARDIPRDREIVLYCTCPNEVSAAEAAKLLMNSGFTRVRPLHGGLDAWIAAGHAVEPIPAGERA
jgi:membrane protein DedA with SNARE-associated domain/rhodanese-related sulfurtransferase